MNRYVIVWFLLGIIWAWGLIAIVGVLIGYNKDVSDIYHIEQTKIPNAIKFQCAGRNRWVTKGSLKNIIQI